MLLCLLTNLFFYPAFAGSPLGDPSKTLQYLCAAGDYTLET
jgi:hypothetical protein